MGSRLLAPILGCGALLAYLTAELYVVGRLGFPLDDSWIHLQFASRLAAGDGLAYNPGQWVAGSSAPLWTALLSLGFLLPLPMTLLWPKVLGSAGLVLSVLATQALGAELGLDRGVQRLAAAMVATSHWLLWSALSGMEVTLFMALSCWGLVFHIRETRRGSGFLSVAIFAVACLTRPEGFLLLMLALGSRWALISRNEEAKTPALDLRKDAEGWHPLLCAIFAVVPVMLFFFWLGGSPAPTTMSAKIRPDLLPSGAYLRLVIDIFWRSQPVLLLFVAGGLVKVFKAPKPGLALPALWLLGLPFAYSLLASPARPMPLGNFGRYYMPMLPLVIVFGLLGLQPLLNSWQNGLLFFNRRWPVKALLIVGLLFPHVSLLFAGPARYVQTLTNVDDSDVSAALWLRQRLPADALLAVQDVGALKFFLPNEVIDLAGLMTPEVQAVLSADDGVYWEERLARFLAQRRPDYLVVFTASYPALTSAEGFERLATFNVENNVTMAGDELVILSTPWTDQPLDGQ